MAFIKFENVSFHYINGKPVIKNAGIQFEKSKFTAVMGPNGSGKTTLGKLLVGILKPNYGRIFIDKKDSSKMSLGEIGTRIGYLFQNPRLQIFSTTVLDELSFVFRLKDFSQDLINRKVTRILEQLNLADKRDSITFNLSYGEMQRLAIAGIIINKPAYLVLDEPTTGLDIARRETLLSILKDLLAKGIGMTVITHDKKFIKNFTGKLIKIDKGEVFETVIK